jgi:hypothetical protein
MIPENYEMWRRCIVEKCGIPLTSTYIQQRIKELSALDQYETQRFIDLYGSLHHQKIIGWFERALAEEIEK